MGNKVLKRPEGMSKEELRTKSQEEKISEKGFKKEVSVLKAENADGETFGPMRPNDEQLEKINKFTKNPKTADEVVCFPTLSCNDITDRDDDKFTTDTVEEFAALPEPYSSVGKSYMLSHDYTKLPVGRIFDVSTTKVGSDLFLRNEVYIPNTDQYKSFIENVDFGVYWAVSVGVMLGAQECSIDGSQMMSFGRWAWCSEGHWKGESYDPNSEEKDGWGDLIPADPEDTNAVKCVRLFKKPQDFYELSQVFLGAQYFAALEKNPDFGGVMKAAGAGKSIVNLTARQARSLPIPHANPEVSEARQKFNTKIESDGSETWTDDKNMVWEYRTSNDEVTCLGKKMEESDGESISRDPVGERPSTESGQGLSKSVPSEEAGRSSDSTQGDQGLGSQELSRTSSQGSSLTSEGEEKALSKEAILASIQKAKLPVQFSETLAAATDEDGLDLVLQLAADQISEHATKAAELEPKAAMGDQYIEALKSEATSWYIKSMQDGNGQVDTKNVDELLRLSGDNVELIKGLTEQYKAVAQSKFPDSVRRSVEPGTPGERQELDEPAEKDAAEKSKVSKLHSK